jgi:hypothetical protein
MLGGPPHFIVSLTICLRTSSLCIRNLFPFDLAIQLVKRPPLFGALRNLVVTPVPQQNIERKNHASHCAGEGRSVNVP